MTDYIKHCVRCKTQLHEDYSVLTLTENFQKAEGYSRITSVKESEATFCVECANDISSVFWGHK